MLLRLFTSGTHNGLNFSNADIDSIASKTLAAEGEHIPIVLGHPKNNLPVLGYLPRPAIRKYQEGDKVSLGFSRDDADLDEESLAAIRTLGRNKISIRLEEGKIRHIGLVEKAAVAENNTQDFAALTGDFAAPDDFCDLEDKGMWTALRGLFKNNKTELGMNGMDEKSNAEFTALKADVEKIGKTVQSLAEILTGQATEQKKESLAADFSAAGYSHLTDDQRQKAIDFCMCLKTEQEISNYKDLLKAGNKKPARPASGSVTADFGATGGGQSAEQLIRVQVEGLK